MAEQLLLVMGERESAYLHWAASRAQPDLKARIDQIREAIGSGARPDPACWPSVQVCAAHLADRDEVVAIMAAQMIYQQQQRCGVRLDHRLQVRVDHYLREASRRPWFVRAADPEVAVGTE
jgi:hypothetical protein